MSDCGAKKTEQRILNLFAISNLGASFGIGAALGLLGGVVGWEIKHRTSAAGGTSGGGNTPQVRRAEQPYAQIDQNTFLVKRDPWGSAEGFGANLAKFRAEQPGVFSLVPAVPSSPLSYDNLAVRASVPSKDGGTNTIILNTSAFPGK